MSALPPKADIARQRHEVHFVPIADLSGYSSSRLKAAGQPATGNFPAPFYLEN
jgi:hypothetical protein